VAERFATNRYQDHMPADGTAVRTTIGRPKFGLAYALYESDATQTLAPTPVEFKVRSDEDFVRMYTSRIAGYGKEWLAATLAGIPGERAVFLCFDDVFKRGMLCHRTLLAEIIHEQLGYEVPELQRGSRFPWRKPQEPQVEGDVQLDLLRLLFRIVRLA
jgi:hypothetical protein